jgi:hypothetical protein
LVGSHPAAVNSHQNTILYTNLKERNRIFKTKICKPVRKFSQWN